MYFVNCFAEEQKTEDVSWQDTDRDYSYDEVCLSQLTITDMNMLDL